MTVFTSDFPDTAKQPENAEKQAFIAAKITRKIPKSLDASVKTDERRCPMGTTGYTYPGRDTKGYELLTLIAVCGDFPASLLSRLPGSVSYQETLISSLKRNKLIKVYYRDKLRSYRLGVRAKAYLLADMPGRISFFLTGSADTNLLKSEITRRLRLHRIAEIYISMLNAGVLIYRDEKPDIFSPEHKISCSIEAPAFYNSREIKEAGIETIKIKGSRMIGTLLTASGMYLVYNCGSNQIKWDYRAEYRAKTLLHIMICQQRMPFQYAGSSVSGLLFGNGMELFYQILSCADSGTRCFFLLDGTYAHFYYLTNDHYGDVLLRLLCDAEQTAELHRILSLDLQQSDNGLSIEHDGLDAKGNPVLFGYLLDIPRINRFLTALNLHQRSGTLICFDFQKEVLQKICSDNVQLQTISFEKFERRFYP